MIDLTHRLRFDAARCEATFSKGIASNIEAAATEIERLREALTQLDSDMWDEKREYYRQGDLGQRVAKLLGLETAN